LDFQTERGIFKPRRKIQFQEKNGECGMPYNDQEKPNAIKLNFESKCQKINGNLSQEMPLWGVETGVTCK